MTYRQAKKLHNGNEVTHKYTNTVLHVVDIKIDKNGRAVFIHCDNGECYMHTTVR